MMDKCRILVFLTVAISFFSACSSTGPEPIQFGKDACEHCKMTIMDRKYGAEIVTSKGKIYKFDAAECMIGYINESSAKVDAAKDHLFTVDLAHPETLIDAKAASYLIDSAFQSPMGANLASFTSKQLAETNRQSPDARVLSWEELLKDL